VKYIGAKEKKFTAKTKLYNTSQSVQGPVGADTKV
jgi:hypothetical protein